MIDSCPSTDLWREYTLGRLAPEALSDVERHLDRCSACAARALHWLDSADELVEALQLARPPIAFAQEPSCLEGLNRACALGDESASTEGDVDGRWFESAGGNRRAACQLRDYELLEPIGCGGMGIVYRARHRKLDRLVALKVLRARWSQSPERTVRFEQEMRAAGRLDHPHIVRATDAGEEDGVSYLAMELIEGQDLARWVEEHGRIAYPSACHLISQAALGLQYAFDQGLVHRDIKPANLMLTREGQLKVLDFGIAFWRDQERSVSRLPPKESHAALIGTVGFMAPEQFEDASRVDVRTDIYSLGATLFYLLTAQSPWPSSPQQRRTEPVLPWHDGLAHRLQVAQPEIPAELIGVVLRMVSHDPQARFAEPRDVVQALAPFLDTSCPPLIPGSSESASGAKGTVYERGKKWPRWWVAGLCLTFILLAGGYEWLRRVGNATDRVESGGVGSMSGQVPNASHSPDQSTPRDPLAPFELHRWTSSEARPLLSVSVSADGQLLATADPSGEIQIWELPSARRLHTLRGHVNGVWGLAFAPTGDRLLSSGDDHLIRLWNAQAGILARQLTGHASPVFPIAWNGDGQLAASGDWESQVFVWNVNTGSHVNLDHYGLGESYPVPQSLDDLHALRAHITWVRAAAFSPTAPNLATGGNEALIAIWDLTTGKLLQRCIGHLAPVACVAYTSDGKTLVSSGFDDRVRIWDPATGVLLQTLEGHTGPVMRVDLSADDQRAVTASADTTVRVWDLRQAKEIACFRGHSQGVNSVAFLPGDQKCVSVSNDGSVRIWQIPVQ